MLLVNNISYRLFFKYLSYGSAGGQRLQWLSRRKEEGSLQKSCRSSLEPGWQNEGTTCWNENPFSLGL